MQYILATHNKDKIIEMSRILKPLGIEAVTDRDLGISLPEVEETGTAFAQNAYLKAASACEATGLPAIADDSGIVVDALNGAPGVYSARYGGEDLDDKGRNRLLLSELDGVPREQRTAHYACVICCVFPDGRAPITAQGEMHGILATEERGAGGFGYDPLFLVGERTVAEMTAEEKDEISHRGNALRAFRDILKGELGV